MPLPLERNHVQVANAPHADTSPLTYWSGACCISMESSSRPHTKPVDTTICTGQIPLSRSPPLNGSIALTAADATIRARDVLLSESQYLNGIPCERAYQSRRCYHDTAKKTPLWSLYYLMEHAIQGMVKVAETTIIRLMGLSFSHSLDFDDTPSKRKHQRRWQHHHLARADTVLALLHVHDIP
jgi:hypothetical protein